MMIHDSDDDDDLAADPLAAFKAGGPRPSNNYNPNPPSRSSTPPTAPVPVPGPASTTFASTGSGFTSINRPSVAPTPHASASQPRAEDDADPYAFDANNIPVGGGEDEADVVEETRRLASSTQSAHRIQGRGRARPRSRSATRERTKSRQATEELEHGHGYGHGQVQGAHVQDQLVPILPRAASASNDGDIIDMTGGDDVVRRVLAEAHKGDEMRYRVELGDYSVEKVRFYFGCDIPSSPHWLLAYDRHYLSARLPQALAVLSSGDPLPSWRAPHSITSNSFSHLSLVSLTSTFTCPVMHYFRHQPRWSAHINTSSSTIISSTSTDHRHHFLCNTNYIITSQQPPSSKADAVALDFIQQPR